MNWGRLALYGLGLFVTLFCLFLGGLAFPLLLVVDLTFGWIFHLARVAPTLRPDPAALGMAAVCLAGLAVGGHRFLTWLWAASGHENAWRARWTAGLIGLVVVAFSAGIAATGVVHQTGWLLASPEGVISSSGGGGARRMQSTNNLKYIGIGIWNSTESSGRLPATRFNTGGRPLHGWQAQILDAVEEGKLYNAINFERPWNDSSNTTAIRTRVSTFMNPAIRDRPDEERPAPSHYAGNVHVLSRREFWPGKAAPDGNSSTILAGEVVANFRPWAHPWNLRDPARGFPNDPEGFGGPHYGGGLMLMLDGSVQFIKPTIDPALFRALGTPAGGEVIRPDQW